MLHCPLREGKDVVAITPKGLNCYSFYFFLIFFSYFSRTFLVLEDAVSVLKVGIIKVPLSKMFTS